MACDMELNDGRPKYGPPSYHEKMSEIIEKPEKPKNDNENSMIVPVNTPHYGEPMQQQQPMMGQAQPILI